MCFVTPSHPPPTRTHPNTPPIPHPPRDLKPENVLMMEDQTCKLCDFGFSINTGVRRPVSRLGTLDFMAPEIVMAGRKASDGSDY